MCWYISGLLTRKGRSAKRRAVIVPPPCYMLCHCTGNAKRDITMLPNSNSFSKHWKTTGRDTSVLRSTHQCFKDRHSVHEISHLPLWTRALQPLTASHKYYQNAPTLKNSHVRVLSRALVFGIQRVCFLYCTHFVGCDVSFATPTHVFWHKRCAFGLNAFIAAFSVIPVDRWCKSRRTLCLGYHRHTVLYLWSHECNVTPFCVRSFVVWRCMVSEECLPLKYLVWWCFSFDMQMG